MSNKTLCDVLDFDVLLSDDQQSDEFHAAQSHLDTCAACQAKLTELAADSDTWDVIRESLSDSNFSVCSPPPSESYQPFAHPIDLPEGIEPAEHPELLGRLGRYHLESAIGSGGMGIVFKGFDTELNRPVALKVLGKHLAHSGAARQRFAREARAAAAVVHEHVVAIHNVESNAAIPFLVMQYVSGESLQTRVDRDGPLTTREVLRIGMQVAAGLAAAHEQGVIHRDVKPANILLENGVERVLLTDFGLARTVDDASLTHTGVVTGTPHYMAPEQANGEDVDSRSDLFSLGSVMYYMATGHPPFRADRPMGVLKRICHDRHRPAWKVNNEIDHDLSVIIDRLLSKRPNTRYRSAEAAQRAMSDALKRLQHGGMRRRFQFLRRPRAWKGSAAVALTLSVIGILALGLNPTMPLSKERHEGGEESSVTSSLTGVPSPQELDAQATDIEAAIRSLEGIHDSHRSFVQGADFWRLEADAIRDQISRNVDSLSESYPTTLSRGDQE